MDPESHDEGLARLAKSVPPAVRSACERLTESGHEAYVVGGAVRDALLGRPIDEWDIASDARPEEVMKLFARTIPTGVAHGTVTALVGRGKARMPIEITTFRGEGAYSDARRPDEVRFGVSLAEDLARRDFVVNAMAYDPVRDHLCDPLGGRADLAARRLRAVGRASERFTEDGLRIMRAVRFVATLELDLEVETERAIAAALPSLARVSRERVRDELLKLMAARQPSRGLSIAVRSGAMTVAVPALAGVDLAIALATIDHLAPEPRLLRLAALLSPLADAQASAALCDLRLSNEQQQRAVRALFHRDTRYSAEWRDGDVRRYVALVGRDAVADHLALRGAIASAGRGDPAREHALARRVDAVLAARDPLTVRELALRGHDVMAILGTGAGPEVGRVLEALLDRVIEEPSLNRRESLAALVPELSRRS